MNLGLPQSLILEFPDVIAAERPTVSNQVIKNPHWLAGFVDGDGCFSISVTADSAYKLGRKVYWTFSIKQHNRDAVLLQSFVNFLGCGTVFVSKKVDACNFAVRHFGDVSEKVVPFFVKYPLRSAKANDFKDFIKAVDLIKAKAHLTEQGIEEINKIRLGMNSLRIPPGGKKNSWHE
uniref:LAGLIDADG endonuclease n=1 Tax=Pyronema omphalodes TaxID=337075 RepID=A0A140IMY2_9PEZI|nr:LAGLIDADG endonuclease [Pyronema omphalodes]AMO66540.1 LAGLIDADG endonuclease [Pyronema omphalodes]